MCFALLVLVGTCTSSRGLHVVLSLVGPMYLRYELVGLHVLLVVCSCRKGYVVHVKIVTPSHTTSWGGQKANQQAIHVLLDSSTSSSMEPGMDE